MKLIEILKSEENNNRSDDKYDMTVVPFPPEEERKAHIKEFKKFDPSPSQDVNDEIEKIFADIFFRNEIDELKDLIGNSKTKYSNEKVKELIKNLAEKLSELKFHKRKNIDDDCKKIISELGEISKVFYYPDLEDFVTAVGNETNVEFILGRLNISFDLKIKEGGKVVQKKKLEKEIDYQKDILKRVIVYGGPERKEVKGIASKICAT